MGLTGNTCVVVASLPGLRHTSMWGHALSPMLLQSSLGTPTALWEVQWDHTDLSAQHFCVTLAASCASKPPLNEWVEVSGNHGHLSLANDPWSSLASGSCSRGSGCFVATGSLACGLQSRAVQPLLPLLACCEMGESGGTALHRRVWP